VTGEQPVLHATLVARMAGGDWRGVLLRGPSGVGKSDLALRLLRDGWWLVADDRVVAWAENGYLYGRAPEVLAGLIELRGQGVVRIDRVRPWAEIALCIDCVSAGMELDRTPEQSFTSVLGVSVPAVRIVAIEASATARIDRLVALP
jgi:serine kinase of HPr protein (carbohydrate metabolism regulator)